ncbi:MAG: 5-oxoprolinase subunit PxpB [Rheinheimera sp.]
MHHREFPQIRQAGENSMLIYLAATATPQVSLQVQWLTTEIKRQLGGLLLEVIPSYHSILVVYDFLQLDHSQLMLCLVDLLEQLKTQQQLAHPTEQSGKLIELPCYYSTESGPDLAAVASMHQMSVSEVIQLHSSMLYQVYAIGFAPGFAYLGWIDERIATPRLKSPRAKVPAGSVAIADRQTAVYPSTSPGGWHLLGHCPLPLFDLTKEPVMPFSIGDSVKFVSIERPEYLRLGGQ